MNKLKYILIAFICICLFSCEKAEIPDAPNFDKTEILLVNAYDTNKSNISSDNPVIDVEKGIILITVKPGIDLTKIFLTCGLSSGANISPALNGYDDWSSKTKSFTVTSASGTRSQAWTITLNGI
nr:hypothetical protein [Parabacteroides goldsteinii]